MSRLRFESVGLAAIAVAGTVASVREGAGGFAVLFVVTGLLAVTSFLRPRARRAVSLRSDLAAWLDTVSATTGEPVEAVLDRSVSAYRTATQAVNDG